MNQNFETVCIQRLAVVFSELAKNILGQNLKIQLKTSFDLKVQRADLTCDVIKKVVPYVLSKL